jgi:hypothetical protein
MSIIDVKDLGGSRDFGPGTSAAAPRLREAAGRSATRSAESSLSSHGTETAFQATQAGRGDAPTDKAMAFDLFDVPLLFLEAALRQDQDEGDERPVHEAGLFARIRTPRSRPATTPLVSSPGTLNSMTQKRPPHPGVGRFCVAEGSAPVW